MPLIHIENINPSTSIALWETAEVEAFFREQLKLAPNDEAAIHTLKLEKRRLERWGCRMALAKLLKTNTINIEYSPNGAPVLPGYHISFSHADGIAAAAISSKKIGLDIELHKDRIRKLYHKFMSEDELKQCNVEQLHDLYYYWCAKEAAFKWLEIGELDFKEDIYVDKQTHKVTIQKKYHNNLFYKTFDNLTLSICY